MDTSLDEFSPFRQLFTCFWQIYENDGSSRNFLTKNINFDKKYGVVYIWGDCFHKLIWSHLLETWVNVPIDHYYRQFSPISAKTCNMLLQISFVSNLRRKLVVF
jgi:hypothetical protein